jgi:hypothetical protein
LIEAIQVLQKIIEILKLHEYSFYFIEHGVGINWRQKYQDVNARISHIEESLIVPPIRKKWIFKGIQVCSPSFNQELKRLPKNDNVISVISRVRSPEGYVYHLPLMNLHPVKEIQFQELIKILRNVIGPMKGYLLESGRYYHFYGIAKFTHKKWLHFNCRFLLTTILVGERYIAFSLIRGYNALRLTAQPKYKPKVPTLCYEL